MRILTIGLDKIINENIKLKLEKYFISIMDVSNNIYDANNFIDFRYYELILIKDENEDYTLKKYITRVKIKKYETKIIILTGNKMNQLKLFKIGSDDVIFQFIDFSDLIIARILANMRDLFLTSISINNLLINLSSKKIEINNKLVGLHGKTFDILAYLAVRKNKVFSKDEIINALWEEPEYVSDNTVEVAINQIRKKLKSISGFQVIHTVRRRGYKFYY